MRIKEQETRLTLQEHDDDDDDDDVEVIYVFISKLDDYLDCTTLSFRSW